MLAPYGFGATPYQRASDDAANVLIEVMETDTNIPAIYSTPFKDHVTASEREEIAKMAANNPTVKKYTKLHTEIVTKLLFEQFKEAETSYNRRYDYSKSQNTRRSKDLLAKAENLFVRTFTAMANPDEDKREDLPELNKTFLDLADKMKSALGQREKFHDIATTEYRNLSQIHYGK